VNARARSFFPVVLLATALTAGVSAGVCPAVRADSDIALQSTEYQFDYDESLDKPWVEGQAKLPPYPREEDLAPVRLKPTSSRTLLVDTASLTVGKDFVVRFVYVLRAPGGGQTVLFEGFRCGTRGYKSYAYGTPDGVLKPFPTVEWREAPRTDYGYRRDLMDSFLCADSNYPYARVDIVRRIQSYQPPTEP